MHITPQTHFIHERKNAESVLCKKCDELDEFAKSVSEAGMIYYHFTTERERERYGNGNVFNIITIKKHTHTHTDRDAISIAHTLNFNIETKTTTTCYYLFEKSTISVFSHKRSRNITDFLVTSYYCYNC